MKMIPISEEEYRRMNRRFGLRYNLQAMIEEFVAMNTKPFK